MALFSHRHTWLYTVLIAISETKSMHVGAMHMMLSYGSCDRQVGCGVAQSNLFTVQRLQPCLPCATKAERHAAIAVSEQDLGKAEGSRLKTQPNLGRHIAWRFHSVTPLIFISTTTFSEIKLEIYTTYTACLVTQPTTMWRS